VRILAGVDAIRCTAYRGEFRYVQRDRIYTGQLVSLMDVAWRSIWITNIHLMIMVINEKHILYGNESKSYHL